MALSWLYPGRCGVCGELLPVGQIGVCEACYAELPFVRPPVCLSCGKELGSTDFWAPEEFCTDCSAHTKDFSGGIALLNYHGAARKLITGFKYENKREYAAFLAKELARRKGRQILSFRPDLLVPVPVHKRRRRERGYNQAGLLARELGRELGIPVREDILVRRINTTAQKKLDVLHRRYNETKAFAANEVIKGRVLLVDDIYTTGATAQGCTTELLKAGAEKVFLVNAAIGGGR